MQILDQGQASGVVAEEPDAVGVTSITKRDLQDGSVERVGEAKPSRKASQPDMIGRQ
jgi:hypothetical protein